jgi:hypothetical protein
MPKMTHKDVIESIMNPQYKRHVRPEMTVEDVCAGVLVRDIKTGRHNSTTKWFAECYSPRLGVMEQWGNTEIDALKRLREFVVNVQGDKWPEIERC